LPEEWNDSWDIIYSNSIDHAISSTKTYNTWLRTLKTGGLLVLGFVVNDVAGPVVEHDCCSFVEQAVDDFFQNEKSVELLETKMIGGYKHYFIKKK